MLRAIVLLVGLAASAPGIAATLYVSASGDDSDGSTPQRAFRSVTKAVTAAASGDTISVAAARYTEKPLMLTKSLTLSGPPVTSDASTELQPLPPIDTLCSKRACITTDSGDRVINISAGTSGPPKVTLANLVILGPDMSKQPAKSSFGIVVDAVPVTVQDVTIVAGIGGPGGGGTNGETPKDPNWTPPSGGSCDRRDTAGCNCRPGATPPDEKNAAGQVAAKSGTGGGVVLNYCPRGGEVNFNGPPNGATGIGNGDAGPLGSSGVAAQLADAQFTRRDGLLAFRGSVAGAGGPGVRGGWGGGGGPGGTRAYFILGCASPNFAMGGDGGPGGVGGVPGTGGSGGAQGGGAFGLTVADATVAATGLGIYGGKGGPGGPGGQGGAGGAGTKGGTGKPGTLEGDCGGGWHGGTGGKGGDAGDGGAGGGGAGGNGGPSIDVVLIGSAKLSGSQPATRGGSGGSGGGGGAAGPKGPLANGGGTGQQESSAQYTLK